MRNTAAKALISASSVGFLAVALLGARPAFAAPPARPAPKPSAAATPVTGSDKGKLVSDHWYTVTVGDGVHYGYYNDRLEKRGDNFFFQNHYWKKEEGYINEEQLGELSEAAPGLKPLFFNFHRTYRTDETQIDGTFKEGKTLTVRVRQNGRELPILNKSVPTGVILAQSFPVWLGLRLPKMKEGQSRSFLSILEDNVDIAFGTVPGRVRLEKADDYAKRTKTRKVTVDFNGVQSVWYAEETGAPLRIVLPAPQNAVVQRVPKAEAERFLSGP